MKYKSYKSLTDLVVKAGANAGGSRRESFYAGLNQSAANLNSYSFLQTLNFSIMAGEHAFDESNKDIIFIEDQETIDQLLSLKFSAKHATVGYIPFKSFMVSLPVKAMSGETKLEPCLVSLDEPEEYKAAMSSFMAKELGMPKDFIRQVFDNSPQLAQSLEPQIRLIIPLPAKNGGIAHLFTGIPYTKIPLILNTPVEKFNSELYTDLIGRSTADSYELEEEEVQLQLKMLRLTIAMFIYNKVTDNKHFRTGVPKGGIAPKYLGLSKSLGKSCRKYVFNKHDEHKGERGKVGVHVRSEHIRQYVDPKFYKGDHANTPIGERFTIVKETLVGEGRPYTQESEKH